MVVKKIGTPLLTNIILGFVVLLSFIYLGIEWRAIYLLKSAVKQKQEELLQYQSKGISQLSREKLKLQDRLKAMEVSYREIVETLSSTAESRMPKEVGDPLKFKEELYKVRTKLKEDGAEINFQFPPGLGFEKYQQDVLPTAEELPIAIEQLEIVKYITSLMLKLNIVEITDIKFDKVRDITLPGSKETIFREFPVEITFKGRNENIINLLHGLSISGFIFKVDYMNLKSAIAEGEPIGNIEVMITIIAAVFPQSER